MWDRIFGKWAQTLKVEVKLWLVRKLVEFGNPNNVIYEVPEEYRPALDTSPDADDPGSAYKSYDISLVDLIQSQLLTIGQTLHMFYKPRGGEKRQYEAIVLRDGGLQTNVFRTKLRRPRHPKRGQRSRNGERMDELEGWRTSELWLNCGIGTLSGRATKTNRGL